MVEYGHGVSEGAGQAAGSNGGGGGMVDAGASIGQFITDSADTLAAQPPGVLLLGLVVIVLGLLILRRAF
jgi:hypothetical protein